jgi:hypothetical protein
MPHTASAFFKQLAAGSLGGPMVGLLLFIAIKPQLLFLAALFVALPLMILSAYVLGLIPSMATSIVLFFARTRLGKPVTVIVTAIAASVFATLWCLAIGTGSHAHGQATFLMFIAAVAAASSLAFTIPEWDAR